MWLPLTNAQEITLRGLQCFPAGGLSRSLILVSITHICATVMDIKKVLLCDDDASDLGRESYSNKAVSRGVGCMTLFLGHSGYEHLWTRLGRCGLEIWNDSHLTINLLHFLAERVDHWGVQVSTALEVSSPEDSNKVENNNKFRIVTMADAPLIIDKNKSGLSLYATKAAKPPLMSSVKRFERKTYGVCILEQQKTYPAENNKPIQFIAYVIWNHYRIGLSSRMRICMVDLEEFESGLVADRQWITFLKDREDLMESDTFSHNVMATLKTGHLVWSFFGQTRTSILPKEGRSLRMGTGRSLVSDIMNNKPVFVQ
ncbi:MAG: hypothetical protein JOS17DRAFT_814992 [Linnemannia elongata]|nr:MAG: hypothetical protein JOS17DRAFT_814992 [Linnemannia elongata]